MRGRERGEGARSVRRLLEWRDNELVAPLPALLPSFLPPSPIRAAHPVSVSLLPGFLHSFVRSFRPSFPGSCYSFFCCSFFLPPSPVPATIQPISVPPSFFAHITTTTAPICSFHDSLLLLLLLLVQIFRLFLLIFILLLFLPPSFSRIATIAAPIRPFQ